MPSEYDPNETTRDWETLQQDPESVTQRLRVQGGWLYRTLSTSTHNVALVFVAIASETTDA